IVPERVCGADIVPLNELRYVSFALYKQALAKYNGRESLIKEYIPLLNCFWGDVVFLTAVQPEGLQKAYAEAGGTLRKRNFYQIQLGNLDRSRMAAMRQGIVNGQPVHTFARFDPRDMPYYASIPTDTVEYYRKELGAGRRPLIFHMIPQILYRGSFSVLDLCAVEL
ncbi:MAG: hypothetical protein KGJ33_00900, partial [Patescibacteria group bacterium]|nr:hypothetical protein [Patescibacteria group bacterium]